MFPLLETVAFAFIIGLTGALAPGPTLVATIQSSITGGWSMGPRVALGHIVIESAIFGLILAGVAATAVKFSDAVALLGGAALLCFGILTIYSSRNARIDRLSDTPVTNPYLAGIVTGITNPYFWIWWLTIGSALLLDAISGGLIFGVAFMVGHWAADTGWLTLVASGIDRGRTILSPRGYTITLALCGVFLVLFGLYYLSTVIRM